METAPRKLALVTGAATSAIGVAITRRLHADGYEIIGSYDTADADAAKRIEEELDHATLVEVDHADRASLQGLVEALPDGWPLSALVSAHSYFALEDPAKFDFELWDRSIAINLSAPVVLFHELATRFGSNGAMVMITSHEGFMGSYGSSCYAGSHAALHNLTMSMANLGGRRGQRVNSVAAGWISGVMDTDEVMNLSLSVTPLGRLGTPEEVAAVVRFLISSEASFVNGTVITVDGGYRGADAVLKYEAEPQGS